MTRLVKKFIDFNSTLQLINGFFCILSIYLFGLKGYNEYINIFSIALALILGLVNIGMLYYEKKRRNPFIVIIIFISTIFYLGRVVTLVAYPLSVIFERDSVTVKDVNYALIFIILSNISMFIGFYLRKKNKKKSINKKKISEYSNLKTRNVIGIPLILIFIMWIQSFGIANGGMASFLIEIFFHQAVILLFSFIYIVYYFEDIPSRIRLQILFIIFSFVFFVTIGGSRGAILGILIIMLVSILVVKQKVLLSKKIIMLFLVLIPITVILYVIATFNRGLEVKEANLFTILNLMDEKNFINADTINFFLGRIFERIGFLDFSTCLIAKREIFSEVINPIYYLKSIVDHILTPGFDVFNTPRASHSLGHIAIGQEIPTKLTLAESYQSDQMGIYGEYYVMFRGYPALIIFFLMAYIFQWIYDSFNRENQLLSFLYKGLFLYLFYGYVNSFGSDWFLFEVVGTIFTGLVFNKYYVESKTLKVI